MEKRHAIGPWDFARTNGKEVDGGGGSHDSLPTPQKRRGLSGWNVIVFGVLKWGTVDLWGDRSVLLVCGLCYFFSLHFMTQPSNIRWDSTQKNKQF